MTISKHLNLKTLALCGDGARGSADGNGSGAGFSPDLPRNLSTDRTAGIAGLCSAPIPAPGYLWTPGYWAYADGTGYYWVPGTWVEPPEVGVLWTPPYWGWRMVRTSSMQDTGGRMSAFMAASIMDSAMSRGLLRRTLGWRHFAYNGAVNNFGSVHIDNVYRQNVTVVNNTHVSFNGGANGVRAEPTPEERAVENEHHIAATSEQTRHFTEAAHNPALAASQNHDTPRLPPPARPAEFTGPGVVHAGASAARPVEHVAAPHPVERAASHPMEARPVAPHPAEGRPAEARPVEARPSASACRAAPGSCRKARRT